MSVYDLIKEYGIEKYQVIDEEALEAITLGSSILATGGGGDPQIGLLWTKKVLKDGYEMVMVDPMDMPDDIIACHAGCLGSPLVLTEKPLSDEVLIESFEALQRYMGKRVGATIPIECGGINSVLSYGVAAKYGVPIVDADGMNRAFPEVQMTSWHTHGLRATPAAVCDNNGTVVVVDTKDDNYLAESICRRTAMTYGGISWTSLYPISMG
ncbi:DUF917 family protein, partial [Oscillospiraceae bacterium OttesenSCG-928-G22]|nr:DUF917 family protein [Oscillospiraceae bacterium OttesenSCG-928-G22]